MSNNLGRVEITANQNNKEVTANSSDAVLDAAITETLVIDVSTGSRLIDDTDIEYADFYEAIHILIQGATVSGRTITIDPCKSVKLVSLDTDATNTVDVIVGTTTLTIEIGELVLIRMDGTTNGLVALTGSGTGGGSGISPRTRRTEATSTTLALADDGDIVTIDSASAVNLTVPPNASVAFATGTVIDISQGGAGQVTVVPDTGVTVSVPSGCTLKLRAENSYATLIKTGTNTWELFGDLELTNSIGAGSETSAGILELATSAETITGTDNTRAVTPAGVKAVIDNLVAAAPGALDTLDELAQALGDDANFATTVTNALATKAPTASPTLTGTPAAPTAITGTNTTQIATTAFVNSQIASTVPAASETAAGKVELATAAETATGTDNTRAVHPAGLAALVSSETAKGIVELATAAETTTGTDNTRAVHPAGLKVELDKKANLTGGTFTGAILAPRYYSGSITLADDTAQDISPVVGATNSMIMLASSRAGVPCILDVRVAATVRTVVLTNSATLVNVVAGDGVLTGTTGTDGLFNVRVNSASSSLYLENRTGSSVTISYKWSC